MNGAAEFLVKMSENGYRDFRVFPDGRYACTTQFMFTTAIIVGKVFDDIGYDDRWCYHTHEAAKAALEAWDGNGEPTGWHRHPASGRRICEETGEMVVRG